ncbi:MAG: hypothetical protein KC492_01195 [Myxococcales bacterium]|nr:hypothetical protein [Myxococcales bacterium]
MRLALLLRFEEFVSREGTWPSYGQMGRWFGVTGPAARNQVLNHFVPAGWVENTAENGWSLTDKGRRRARREAHKRRGLFRDVHNTLAEEGPHIYGYIDRDLLVRIWRGGATEALGYPQHEMEFGYLAEIAPELEGVVVKALETGNVVVGTVPRQGHHALQVWAAPIDPEDEDLGVVLKLYA